MFDWICKGCDELIYSRKAQCNKCNLDREN